MPPIDGSACHVFQAAFACNFFKLSGKDDERRRVGSDVERELSLMFFVAMAYLLLFFYASPASLRAPHENLLNASKSEANYEGLSKRFRSADGYATLFGIGW